MSTNELIVSKEYGAGELSREALAIRQTVFVSEQGVPLALEIDDLDDRTTHYVIFTAFGAGFVHGASFYKWAYDGAAYGK